MVGDSIDGTFIRFEEKENHDEHDTTRHRNDHGLSYHLLSYVIKHPDRFVIHGIVTDINEKYYDNRTKTKIELHRHDNNRRKKSIFVLTIVMERLKMIVSHPEAVDTKTNEKIGNQKIFVKLKGVNMKNYQKMHGFLVKRYRSEMILEC